MVFSTGDPTIVGKNPISTMILSNKWVAIASNMATLRSVTDMRYEVCTAGFFN
jgi:hypothetical protein